MGTRYRSRKKRTSFVEYDQAKAPASSLSEGSISTVTEAPGSLQTRAPGDTPAIDPVVGEKIDQYETPVYRPITLEDRYALNNIHHIWTVGDHYWKLANDYYGDPGLWYLIAWYNQKPTEAHVKIGDSLAIPLPIQDVMRLFNG
tara:strand:- start:590 stop:1021 length:432 start_codon:yes stop_codon:yes gene_type:complete